MTYPVEHLLHTKCVYEHAYDGFHHEINPGMIYTLFQLLDDYFVLVQCFWIVDLINNPSPPSSWMVFPEVTMIYGLVWFCLG
jgi:hypothetical protein